MARPQRVCPKEEGCRRDALAAGGDDKGNDEQEDSAHLPRGNGRAVQLNAQTSGPTNTRIDPPRRTSGTELYLISEGGYARNAIDTHIHTMAGTARAGAV